MSDRDPQLRLHQPAPDLAELRYQLADVCDCLARHAERGCCPPELLRSQLAVVAARVDALAAAVVQERRGPLPGSVMTESPAADHPGT